MNLTLLAANNAQSVITSGINSSATSLNVATGAGDPGGNASGAMASNVAVAPGGGTGANANLTTTVYTGGKGGNGIVIVWE